MAANQLLSPMMLGYVIIGGSNSTTLGLNAAATWLAMQFVPEVDHTLSTVRMYLSSKTGTPAASECTAELYSDASGVPNASIESRNADSVPASGNWMQWSGFTTALTAGTPYWIVFKNSNATPASNFPTYLFGSALGGGAGGIPLGVTNGSMSLPFYGWNKVHTTNSGTSWASGLVSGVSGMRLGFSDSTYSGFPLQNQSRPGNQGTGNRVFGKQEVGVRFNIPAGVTFNIKGLWFWLNKVSTPGALRFRLYQGVTLLGTTFSIPAANVSTLSGGDGYAAYFSSPISVVSTNQPFRAVIGDATEGDANTVGYNPQLCTFDSDANSLPLKPMNGTLQKTITADNTANPVVFADTAADIIPFALLLDTAGELTAAAGGGGLLVPPRSTGGFHRT